MQCRVADPYYGRRDVGPLAYAAAPRRFFVFHDRYGANGRVIHLRTLGAVDLRDEHGGELRLALAQPKRLALLVYLAIASPAGFHRRDTMLSLFWPEMDQERARRALRQAVHFLRSTLGSHVVQTRGGEDIGLASDALSCDVRAFDDALARGAQAEALELYRGDLLDGFFISDASADFEEWLEQVRVRLRQRAIGAAWSLSDEHAAAGRGAQAAEWARWAAARAPDDERAQRRLMSLLDRQGDRTGALRVYEQLAQRAQAEFDAEPFGRITGAGRVDSRTRQGDDAADERRAGRRASKGGRASCVRVAAGGCTGARRDSCRRCGLAHRAPR